MFNFLLKVRKINFSLKLAYHKVYFSAAWCKRSLLYDQTIEDINIFLSCFLVELRGMAQLTPLSPTIFTWVNKYVMYKVCCHGNNQVMTLKIAVFVKYGTSPVERYHEMFATSGVPTKS